MRHNVPTVPSQTVQPGPNGYYAYVIGPNDTVKRQAVEVAAMQDGLAVINKGLTAGERVVVAGQYRLTDGARVKLVAGKPRRDRTAMSISQPFIHRPIATSLLMPGDTGLRYRRLHAIASRGIAECRLSHDHRDRQLSWGKSRDDGFSGCYTVGATVHRHSVAGTNDVLERHRHHNDHAAIRPVAQYRRSRAGCADRDQRRRWVAAEGPAQSTDLQEDQSGQLSCTDLRGLFRCTAGQSA